MWFDRLKQQKQLALPTPIEPGRYIWMGKEDECLNGHSYIHRNMPLVSDKGSRCSLNSASYDFVSTDKSQEPGINLFENALKTINSQLVGSAPLASPMLPSALVEDESQLLPVEESLLHVLNKGHLHNISHRPRIDIRYEEEVTDASRAKRLAKNALVHLASHSECWQRQTLSGVVPKKIKARFSYDDFQIYENRVYVRLLDKLDLHLLKRIRKIEALQDTVEQALSFYNNESIHYILSRKICELWGQTFDKQHTSQAKDKLEKTLVALRSMHRSIRQLKQAGLYLLVTSNTNIGHSLHRTNILSHDKHYRHVAILWDGLNALNLKSQLTPAEQFTHQSHLAECYSQYTGLLLQQALQPYIDTQQRNVFHEQSLSFDWAGKRLFLKQKGLDWLLTYPLSGSNVTVLRIIPWLGFTEVPQDITLEENNIIVWPALDQQSDAQAMHDINTIAASPMDLYCVERIGWLIDQRLSTLCTENYGKVIDKIPQQPLSWIRNNKEMLCDSIVVTSSTPPSLRVWEGIEETSLQNLIALFNRSNAKQQAEELQLRTQEIRALEVCPVCSSKNALKSQQAQGFLIKCHECSSERYLQTGKGVERHTLHMTVAKAPPEFATLGRWYSDK
jgi:transposase-like protein